MLKSHERFHSKNGKRLLLVADDEYINREILRNILQDEYELIFAENGQEVLDRAREHKDALSLIVMDLMMPVMSGMDALKAAKADPELLIPAVDRTPGGLGIFLTKKLMDGVSYEYRDGRNILKLIKKA